MYFTSGTTGEPKMVAHDHLYALGHLTTGVYWHNLHTGGKLRFVNVNDGTCEGVDYPEFHAFSLQFHPEAHGGPLDCLTAFDRFTAMMKEGL